MHTYIYTYTHVLVHICIHSTYMYVCTYACMYVFVCMHVCMYLCMHVCICMHACMYVCMYVFMYLCMYEVIMVMNLSAPTPSQENEGVRHIILYHNIDPYFYLILGNRRKNVLLESQPLARKLLTFHRTITHGENMAKNQ